MKLFQTKINEEDSKTISEVLKSGDLGFGPNVSILEEKWKNFSNKKHNVATNSASAAAFMIFAYLKEKYGKCDVFTPSLGFASPAWAAKHFGHNIIWVEVDDNLLFDVSHYQTILRHTCEKYTDGGVHQVIMPILYGGVSTIPNFQQILDNGYNKTIVVDSAHCVTPTIKSDFSFFSFHPYKPIAASDGGMISTDDKEATEWFQAYRNFGRQNINGSYDITMDGFKFYMNNLNATIALTQLDRYKENLNNRKENHKLIKSLDLKGKLLSHDNQSSYYFSTLICNEDNVDELVKKYPTSKHYPLLHKTKYFEDGTILSNTERIHKLILNLPLHDKNIYNS